MAASVAASGSQAATVTTTHTLATQAAASGGGHYQLRVDANAMVGGDELRLTLETKARAADTTRVVYESYFANVQACPILLSPAVAIQDSNELVCKLTQTTGTSRTFTWALLRLDA
jgi:hypothetical protein